MSTRSVAAEIVNLPNQLKERISALLDQVDVKFSLSKKGLQEKILLHFKINTNC